MLWDTVSDRCGDMDALNIETRAAAYIACVRKADIGVREYLLTTSVSGVNTGKKILDVVSIYEWSKVQMGGGQRGFELASLA